MRASRLLSILLLLQTRGRLTGQALADEFEVSVRTIYRDIDDLSAAGVPVYADRGRMGGFQLLDGYRTRLTGMTAAEQEAMFLSGLPGPARDLGLGDAVAAAQLKLLAALPDGRRDEAGRVAARFHLDPVGWFRHPERTELLPGLAEAVWNARRIRLRYDAWKGVVERVLDPLGLVLKGGAWYLVAAAHGQPRTYRIASIEAVELTDEAFERPAFDLAGYWTGWAKDFEARLYRGVATVRLSKEGMWRLGNLMPAAAEIAAQTAGPPDAQGWVEAQVPVEIDALDHAAAEMLKLGEHGEVLAPPELRARMAEIAGRLHRIYATG